MSKLDVNAPHRSTNVSAVEEIDIMIILKFLYSKRLTLGLAGVAGALLGIGLSFMTPNMYTSEVKLSPIAAGGMNSMLQKYGGLASLAGFALPQGGGDDKTDLALATLDSDSFLIDFIVKNSLEASVIAATRWDSVTGQLSYDPDLTDSKGQLIPPSPENAGLTRELILDEFKQSLSVSTDQASGFITMRFTHVSPVLARQVLGKLVEEVNVKLRNDDVAEAESAIAYLEEYVEQVQFAEVKQVVYELVQSQIETIMLAKVRQEYVFRVIDGPSLPVKRSSPVRLLYLVLGFASAIAVFLAAWGASKLRDSLDSD